MIFELTRSTLIDFRYYYDKFDCGDEKLWYGKGEQLSGKIISDNGETIDIMLDDNMCVTDSGKKVKALPKDSYKIIKE